MKTRSGDPAQEVIDQLKKKMSHGDTSYVLNFAKKLIDEFPKSSVVWNLKGCAYVGMRQYEEAILCFESAVSLDSENFGALNNLGYCFRKSNRLQESARSYRRSIEINPSLLVAYCNLGNVLIDMEQYDEAIAYCERAISRDFEFAPAYHIAGIASRSAGKIEEAHSFLLRAIDNDPDNADYRDSLGSLLKGIGSFKEAIKSYKKAIALSPNHFAALNNLGNLMREIGELDEAVNLFQKAISFCPKRMESFNNLGNALKDVGDYEAAFQAYSRSIEIDSEAASPKHNLGRLHWLFQKFNTAFDLMEYRWKLPDNEAKYEEMKTTPRWNDGTFGTVLVWREQGIGEDILFSSIIPEFCEKVDGVILDCDTRLHPIFERSFDEDIVYVDRRKVSLSEKYGSQIPFGSLTCHFRRDASDFIRAEGGWLKFSVEKSKRFRAEINDIMGRSGALVVGLSWFTASDKTLAWQRNIDLPEILAGLSHLDLIFVNLQYGDVDKDIARIREMFGIEILDLKGVDLFEDLDGLAGLMAACDVIVTADNINANLAGALGLDTCVLLPMVADERWGLTDQRSYWFRNVRIYRQEVPGNWGSVVKCLGDTLMSRGKDI